MSSPHNEYKRRGGSDGALPVPEGGASAAVGGQVFVQPGGDLLHAADPVGGPAAAAELVAFALEDHDSGVHAEILQRRVHFNAVLQGAAIVFVGMDKEGADFRACKNYGPLYK